MSQDGAQTPRRRRADARRNVDALIEAARTVFAASGVDAPANRGRGGVPTRGATSMR